MTISINGRSIGKGNPPYVIAELSGNHNGSLDRAKETIDVAVNCGVDAVKLQTYTADTMTIDCDLPDFMVEGGLWHGYKLYDLYRWAETPFEWHKELFAYARSRGITVFSTPFDETAVDLLEELNAPAYKIASFELTDIPLISYVAKKKKPIILSTGMATEGEIADAVEAARDSGCDQLILMHCVSSYPAPVDQSNLLQINYLAKRFDTLVGLSDHTMGTTAAVAAVALGAVAIEKHFTLSRNDPGPDSAFSLEPEELKSLCKQASEAWSALGRGVYSRPNVEKSSLVFRRSLFFVEDAEAGDQITHRNVRRIRPGTGLSSKYYDEIIGLRLRKSVKRGTPVSVDVIDFGDIQLPQTGK